MATLEKPADLTLLGLGLIKINTVSANFNNPRPTLYIEGFSKIIIKQGLLQKI